MERFSYMIDAAYFWQKSIKERHGKMSGCLFGNLILEVSTKDDVLRARLNAVFSHSKSRFKEALDEASKRGDIAPLNSDLTSEAMLAYLEGMILFAKVQNDPEVLYRLGPGMITIRIE